MNTWMREEREERAKPKKNQKEDKYEKFFTKAHINQGESKTVITIEYVKKHKEKMVKQCLGDNKRSTRCWGLPVLADYRQPV